MLFTNATIQQVRPEGETDEWAGGTGAAAGEREELAGQRVYLREKWRRRRSGETENRVLERILIVPTLIADLLQPGDVVTWLLDGVAAPMSGKIGGAGASATGGQSASRAAGVPGVVQTTRIEIEEVA